MNSTQTHREVDSLDFLKLQTQTINERFLALENFLKQTLASLLDKINQQQTDINGISQFLKTLHLKSESHTTLMQSLLKQSKALTASALTSALSPNLTIRGISNQKITTDNSQRFAIPKHPKLSTPVVASQKPNPTPPLARMNQLPPLTITPNSQPAHSNDFAALLPINLSLNTPSHPAQPTPTHLKPRLTSLQPKQTPPPFETPQARNQQKPPSQPPKLRSRNSLFGKRKIPKSRNLVRLQKIRRQSKKRKPSHLLRFQDRLDRIQFNSQDLHTGTSTSSFCDQSHFLDRLSKDDSLSGIHLKPSLPLFPSDQSGSRLLNQNSHTNFQNPLDRTWNPPTNQHPTVHHSSQTQSENLNIEEEHNPKPIPKVPSLHFESIQMASERNSTPSKPTQPDQSTAQPLLPCKSPLPKHKKSSPRMPSYESNRTVQKNDSLPFHPKSSFRNPNTPNRELSIFNLNKHQANFSSQKSLNFKPLPLGRTSSLKPNKPAKLPVNLLIRDPCLEDNSPSSISHSRLQRDLNALRFDFSYFAESKDQQALIPPKQNQHFAQKTLFPAPNPYVTPFPQSQNVLNNNNQTNSRPLNRLSIHLNLKNNEQQAINQPAPITHLSSIPLLPSHSLPQNTKPAFQVPDFAARPLADDSFFSQQEQPQPPHCHSQDQKHNFLQALDFAEFKPIHSIQKPNASRPAELDQLKKSSDQELLNSSQNTQRQRLLRQKKKIQHPNLKDSFTSNNYPTPNNQRERPLNPKNLSSPHISPPNITIENDSGLLKMTNQPKNFSAFSGIAFKHEPYHNNSKNDDSNFHLDFLAQLDMKDDKQLITPQQPTTNRLLKSLTPTNPTSLLNLPPPPKQHAPNTHLFQSDLNRLKTAMDRNHYQLFDNQFESKFNILRTQLTELNQIRLDATHLLHHLSHPGSYSGAPAVQKIVAKFASPQGMANMPSPEHVQALINGLNLDLLQAELRKLISDQFGFNSFLILVKKSLSEHTHSFRSLFN